MSGGNKVISIYADYLTQKGHEVLIVTIPPPSPSIKQRLKDIQKFKFFYPKRLKSHFDYVNVKLYCLDSHRAIENEDIPESDFVIATWWETAEWLQKLNVNKGKKIYFIQGHEVFDYLPKDRVIKTYKSNSHKIAVSNWLKKIIETNYGAKDVDVVQNAIDVKDFYFIPRDKQNIPTLGFLMSDSSVKGVDLAFKVIEELKLIYPNLKVISFGALQVWEMSFASKIKAMEYHFLPTTTEIREIYQNCDVWISCSRSEGFNLTAIEAMACGTPIVSTRTGWPVEAVNQYENGILVEIDNLRALIEGVKWLFDQTNESWMNISKSAAITTSEYSWKKSADKFESILLNQMLLAVDANN
jgi:glycosyltransferase involved in cell wall biosynthesis